MEVRQTKHEHNKLNVTFLFAIKAGWPNFMFEVCVVAFPPVPLPAPLRLSPLLLSFLHLFVAFWRSYNVFRPFLGVG